MVWTDLVSTKECKKLFLSAKLGFLTPVVPTDLDDQGPDNNGLKNFLAGAAAPEECKPFANRVVSV